MPLWLAAYLIVGTGVGATIGHAVLFMADDPLPLAAMKAIGNGIVVGLLWPFFVLHLMILSVLD